MRTKEILQQKPRLGRKQNYNEPTVIISYRCPKSMELDYRAKSIKLLAKYKLKLNGKTSDLRPSNSKSI
jgi:hypothetical protein